MGIFEDILKIVRFLGSDVGALMVVGCAPTSGGSYTWKLTCASISSVEKINILHVIS